MLAKRVWFTLAGKSPFRHLIYPVGDHKDHQGIHMTLDMGGQLRFGPDLEWVETTDYRVDDSRRAADTDFIIQGAEVHGTPGLIALYGIESPGLTASLAIGEEVARRRGATVAP